jgi:hypothetical protein
MKTSEIHVTFVDDNEKDIIFFVLCFKDETVMKKFAFRNREKAEETAISWNNSVDTN